MSSGFPRLIFVCCAVLLCVGPVAAARPALSSDHEGRLAVAVGTTHFQRDELEKMEARKTHALPGDTDDAAARMQEVFDQRTAAEPPKVLVTKQEIGGSTGIEEKSEEHSALLGKAHRDVQTLQEKLEQVREHLQENDARQSARKHVLDRLREQEENHAQPKKMPEQQEYQASNVDKSSLSVLENGHDQDAAMTDNSTNQADVLSKTDHQGQPKWLLDEGHSSVVETKVDDLVAAQHTQEAQQRLSSNASEVPSFVAAATDPDSVLEDYVVPLKAAIVAFAAMNDGKCPKRSPIPVLQVDQKSTYGVGCNFQGEQLCKCRSSTMETCDTELIFSGAAASAAQGQSLTTDFVEKFGHCRPAAWVVIGPIVIFMICMLGCCAYLCFG